MKVNRLASVIAFEEDESDHHHGSHDDESGARSKTTPAVKADGVEDELESLQAPGADGADAAVQFAYQSDDEFLAASTLHDDTEIDLQ